MMRELVDSKAYFILHAPRQVGKSTSLQAVARALTKEGRYAAILVSMETGAPKSTPIGAAEDAILDDWRGAITSQLPAELWPPPWPDAPPQRRIGAALAAWARHCPRPLVLFLDEIDSLQGDLLVSVLRQVRSGYPRRPAAFPHALALCGMRDVRDYRVDLSEPERAHSASPFNVKESLGLRNFNESEVAALYQQHTEQTGQRFEPAAVRRAFELSGGHPWLVNAIGAHLMDELVLDRSTPITAAHVEQAKEAMIRKRETHLDSLTERLREPRVRRVIEPILVGADFDLDIFNDDLVYARDLGLIIDQPQVRIANPIYQEIVPRALTYLMQLNLQEETRWYLRQDGTLDMILLLAAIARRLLAPILLVSALHALLYVVSSIKYRLLDMVLVLQDAYFVSGFDASSFALLWHYVPSPWRTLGLAVLALLALASLAASQSPAALIVTLVSWASPAVRMTSVELACIDARFQTRS